MRSQYMKRSVSGIQSSCLSRNLLTSNVSRSARQYSNSSYLSFSSFKIKGRSSILNNSQHLNINRYGLGSKNQIKAYSVTTDGKEIPDEIDILSIDEYHKKADIYLELLVERLEEIGEEYRDLDVDYADGVLNMDLPPNGSYCINKQPPNKQIWLSSPVSGPNRYDLVKGKWVSLRDGSNLTSVLEQEVKQATDIDSIKFDFE